jgi:hypothetical protein
MRYKRNVLALLPHHDTTMITTIIFTMMSESANLDLVSTRT